MVFVKRVELKSIFLVGVVLVLSCSFFTIGCGGSDERGIKKTLESFCEALENQEYSRILDYISQTRRASSEDKEILDEYVGFTLKLKHIADPVINYSLADVWVDVELSSGLVKTLKFHLIKEDKSWYIWDFDR